MISEEAFEVIHKAVSTGTAKSKTGFFLMVFDPTLPTGELFIASNVEPLECLTDRLKTYLEVSGPSPNKK